MFNWRQYQHKVSKSYNLRNHNNDQQKRQLSNQLRRSLNNNATVSSSSNISNCSNINDNQPFLETNVTINLFDCMKCYIRISRCKIDNEQEHDPNTNLSSTVNHQSEELQEDLYSTDTKMELGELPRELREEKEEKESQDQQNQTPSQQLQEEKFFDYTYYDDREMFNFIEQYICIDLPYPSP